MTTLYDIDLLQSRIHHLESENDGLIEVASELNKALLQVAQERDLHKRSSAAWKRSAKVLRTHDRELDRYTDELIEEKNELQLRDGAWGDICAKALNKRDDLRQKLEKSELRNHQYSDALHNISHYIQKQCENCDRVESCVAPAGSDPKDYSQVEIVWIRGIAFVNAKKHEETVEKEHLAGMRWFDDLSGLVTQMCDLAKEWAEKEYSGDYTSAVYHLCAKKLWEVLGG